MQVKKLICEKIEDISFSIKLEKGCNKEVEISINDIIPVKIDKPWLEEYISFSWRCPECFTLNPLNEKLLTLEDKRYLMMKYERIIIEIYKLYQKREEQKILKSKLVEVNNEIDKILMDIVLKDNENNLKLKK